MGKHVWRRCLLFKMTSYGYVVNPKNNLELIDRPATYRFAVPTLTTCLLYLNYLLFLNVPKNRQLQENSKMSQRKLRKELR